MNKKLSNNKSAFTLVETLVVITIIGILTSLPMVAIQNSREGARNAKRIADAKQMQIALELYYHDNGLYPSSLNPGESLASNSIVYMETIPLAPIPNDGTCSEEENTYTYLNPYRLNYFYIDEEQSTYFNWDYDRNYYSIHFCIGEESGGLLAGEVVASPRGLNNWACGDLLLDYRDGQYYETVQIGNQCWMAENMRYDNGCSSTEWVNYSDEGWCGVVYDGVDDGIEALVNFGKLYQWSAAMNYNASSSQGVCPDGWHVPSSDDWDAATTTVNNNLNYRCNGIDGAIVKSLSSVFGFQSTTSNECFMGNNTLLNNTTRFNAFPAGYRNRNGNFSNYTWEPYFWTSSLQWSDTLGGGGYYPGFIRFPYDSVYVSKAKTYHAYAFAVRCVKD
jgi:uncharacterized protein (TIGR02145 family)/prepilin-type N-terminal cleavage/methylation domain-containing protein